MAGERIALITTRSVGENERDVFLRESEIRSLISTLGLNIVCHQSFTVKEENSVYYIGKGQTEEAVEYSRAFDAEEVVIDVFLSPRQESCHRSDLLPECPFQGGQTSDRKGQGLIREA